MSKVGTFNYPGGKTTIADWIIQHIPEHEVYVEPFGGSAGVLANKPESPLEVYNDTASLCVDFFRAVKHHPEELQHWVQTTPYSRELFDEYTERLQQDPPEDLVERAGMFWYTQFTSFAGKGVICGGGGLTFSIQRSVSGSKNRQDDLISAANKVSDVCDRFREVQIEHMDFGTVFEKYDSAKTVFYCDPPYVDVGDDYYQTEDSGFNHERFVDSLHDLDGKWLVSYDHNIPTGLQDYTIIDRQKRSTMDHEKAEKTESLVMNFDAEGERVMSELGQSGLNAYQ
jgi:DNA adenine methylase